MKISCFIILLATLHVSASVYSQNTSLDLSVQEVTMRDVFKQIEQESEFRFFYNDEFKDLNKKVSLNIKDKKIGYILDALLQSSDVTYKILENNLIVITPLETNEMTVNGTVTSAEDGSGLPGVNVIIKGTAQGTVTDLDGRYSIEVPDETTVLVFSSVGFVLQEVTVGNQTTINISLRPDVTALEEIVVIGYGTQKRSDLTGSVGSMNNKEFEGRNINSLEEGLQGQLAGVHVNQATGQPGGKTIVRIRGQNSILGSSDPLYVLDGVPIQSGTDGNTSLLTNINPADIESIDVLKDASATAIYGARGSNGVILITTKQGRAGQKMVNIESSVGFSNAAKVLDLLDSREFVEIANEQALNDGQTLPFPDENAVLASGINTNWQEEIFQTALTQNYTISFSGGDENTQYFASGSYMDQEGIIVNSGFTRGSFKLNLNQQIGERLKLSSFITASRSTAERSSTDARSGGVLRDALGSPPILPPRDENGNYTPGDELYGFPFSESAGDNPLITAYERMNKLTINRFVGNVRAQYSFFENLSADLMLGTDYSGIVNDQYDTRLLRGNPDGSGSERRTESNYFIVENLYKYNRYFGKDAHSINAIAGFTWESSASRFLYGASEGFVTDDFSNQNLGAGERPSPPENGITEWDLVSFLARFNYAYKDKYLATVSGRQDGSSRFGEGNKWAFFPSLALAWRLSSENFMEQAEEISDLKLRFSLGRSGNQAINPYQSLQRFTEQPLVIGGTRVVGFAPDNLSNPNLKWETTDQINLGVDLGMWDQILRLTIDLYHKKTSDLLALVVLPPTSGFTSLIQNVGIMENRGIEFNFGLDIFRGVEDLSWDVNFNVSSNRNTVQKLDKGSDIILSAGFTGETILREGEPVASFYGIVEDGLTDNGLINYVDQNGDGDINNDDRIIIGNPHPDFVFGFNTRIDYKRFYLTAFLQGEYGKDILNENLYWHGLPFFRGNNVITAVEDRWTQENPNTDAAYPKATVNLNFYKSDRYVEDGTYVRLKNVRIGYNVPSEKIHLRNLDLFISAENLFTITNYSWYDPDVNTFQSGDLKIGWDMNTYPVARTVTVGISIGL